MSSLYMETEALNNSLRKHCEWYFSGNFLLTITFWKSFPEFLVIVSWILRLFIMRRAEMVSQNYPVIIAKEPEKNRNVLFSEITFNTLRKLSKATDQNTKILEKDVII